ncbi:MAG: ATP-grasp domain-containing protein [Betaproteobacteria bacterium]|nr:ATP-grasp domain-containing protein [Betaproteobacteria bacterium]
MPGSAALSIDRIAALPPYFSQVLPELAGTGFLPALERARLPPEPPAALGMTLAWLTAQLQNAGCGCVNDAAYARAANGDVLALSGYQVPEVAAQAMQLACAFIAAGWEALDPARLVRAGHPALQQNLANFLQFARGMHLDVQTYSIVNAARERDIPHYRLCSSARFMQLGQGVHLQHIHETVSDRTSEAGAKISHNKIATHHLLRGLGLPTAQQIPVATFEQAAATAAQIGYPVVVKPSHGLQTRGVTVGVRNGQELKVAFQTATDAGLGSVLIENLVSGFHHRLLVIGGRLVAAVRWIPAHVVGDGIHTIDELLAIANRDPARGDGSGFEFDFGKKRVRMAPNPEMTRMLAAQGLDYSSVPSQGRHVQLHGVNTIASGGDGVDVTEEVHPDVREMAEFIAQAFKLETVGIDYLSADVSRTYRNGGGAVCEVNACPGFQGHLLVGCDRNRILGALLQRDFPEGQTGRVPTVAIAGSPRAATVTRMVAHILEASGKTTALAYSGGVTVGTRPMRDEDSAGGPRARAVMLDPRVEAVVMELGSASLLAVGMPVDSCDVGAVLDVEFAQPRQDGIDLAETLAAAKSLVLKAASRYAVLNADDARCVSMAAELQVPICWVAVNPDNPVLRKNSGNAMTATLAGAGVTEIVITRGAVRQCAIPVSEISTGSTRMAEALFAVAIACALDIPCEIIKAALKSFLRDKR